MDSPDIVLEVVAKLSKLDTSSAEIAKAADVPESWLKMFRRGKIPNPGVRHFQRVVDYLDRAVA